MSVWVSLMPFNATTFAPSVSFLSAGLAAEYSRVRFEFNLESEWIEDMYSVGCND